MPHVLRGLVLAGALALAGCGLGKVAQEPAKQQPVTAAQLAAMVVPRAELGDLAAGMRAQRDSGVAGNALAADDTLDPLDTGTSLRGAGRLTGHQLGFEQADSAAARNHGGLAFVGTSVELLEDTVSAAQYLHRQVADYARFEGQRVDGVLLRSVRDFDVPSVGEESAGIAVTVSGPGGTLYATFAGFRRGRLVGSASLVRVDRRSAVEDAREVAAKLDERVQGVLSGAIAAVPTPEGRRNEAAEDAALLTKITLSKADTGAPPILEDRTDGKGYVGYSRTFEDVFAKDSHLIRLQATASLFTTSRRAAAEYRKVSTKAGRRAFVRIVLARIAKEEGARPTDVQVTPVENLGPGVPGVDVLFNLNGVPYRFATGFIRKGRALEVLTGFCTASAFHPSDLEPLAQRARARLSI